MTDTTTAVALPPGVSPADIDLRRATDAYNWSSMWPERRAAGLQREYLAHMAYTWEQLSGLANTEERREVLAAEWPEYRRRYLQHFYAWLGAQSRTASSFVTGPANFPVERNQKRLDTCQRRYEEWQAWNKRALNAIKERISPTPPRGISSDRSDAPELLAERIAVLRALQDRMKAVNSVHARYLKDPASLDSSDLPPEDKALIATYAPAYSWEPHPFPPYALQNNLSNIKRLEARVVEVAVKREQPEREAALPGAFAGGRVVDNVEENRLQVFFDGKPPADTRAALKGVGFRWAPSVGCWQRQRGIGAVRALENAINITLIWEEKSA